ncbi:MAG: hypothetical protein JW943_01150 [Deltaproteobacteria bacterium]|nr:hypothetical protein [Deltaproteobacteria bacterium]
MKFRLLSSGVVFALIICFSPMVLPAQGKHELKSLQADGRAAIVNNNLARAQREAIRDALGKAVENVLMQYLSPELMAGKAAILKKNIYDAADAYVQTYKIISEMPDQKEYVVVLTATVDFTALKDDIRALGFAVAPLRIENVATITMTVRGIRSCADYARFIRFLRSDTDVVKDVRVRRAGGGSLGLDIDTAVSVSILTEKLTGKDEFSFHLNQIDKNQLEATLLD